MLTIGPTESGKEAIRYLLNRALKKLSKVNSQAVSIPTLQTRFASPEGMWWLLQDGNPALLFDSELGALFSDAIKERGQAQDILVRLIKVHDAVRYDTLEPIRYSKRDKSANEMEPLHYPFLAVQGTATPLFFSKAHSLVAESGSLNRFLILNCEGEAPARARETITDLPKSIIQFVEEHQTALTRLECQETALGCQLKKVEQFKQERRTAPGTWGRFGIKSSRLALLSAVAKGSDCVSLDDMRWGCSVVECASRIATQKFEENGGLSASDTDGLLKAVLAMFQNKPVQDNDGILTRRILDRYFRKWRASNITAWDQVIGYLERDKTLIRAKNGWKLRG